MIEYFKCSCGAVTITVGGSNYSVKNRNLKKFLPDLDLRKAVRYPETFGCDHCVNRFGLDLCGCGSGEPFGKCDNGLPECEMPMQKLGEYSYVRAANSLI